MRDIKFRAWLKDTKEMVEVSQLTIADNATRFGSGILDQHNDLHGSIDIVLMQFTGLKDKNGKEIYEGDVLEKKNKPYYKYNSNGTLKKVVKWTQSSVRTGWNIAPSTTFEVIGNIYENPELL